MSGNEFAKTLDTFIQAVAEMRWAKEQLAASDTKHLDRIPPGGPVPTPEEYQKSEPAGWEGRVTDSWEKLQAAWQAVRDSGYVPANAINGVDPHDWRRRVLTAVGDAVGTVAGKHPAALLVSLSGSASEELRDILGRLDVRARQARNTDGRKGIQPINPEEYEFVRAVCDALERAADSDGTIGGLRRAFVDAFAGAKIQRVSKTWRGAKLVELSPKQELRESLRSIMMRLAWIFENSWGESPVPVLAFLEDPSRETAKVVYERCKIAFPWCCAAGVDALMRRDAETKAAAENPPADGKGTPGGGMDTPADPKKVSVSAPLSYPLSQPTKDGTITLAGFIQWLSERIEHWQRLERDPRYKHPCEGAGAELAEVIRLARGFGVDDIWLGNYQWRDEVDCAKMVEMLTRCQEHARKTREKVYHGTPAATDGHAVSVPTIAEGAALPSTAPPFVFKMNGTMWEVRFGSDDEERPYKHLRGFEIIAKLLTSPNPDRPFKASDFRDASQIADAKRLETGKAVSGDEVSALEHTSEDVVDPEGMQRFKTRLEQIKEERELAEGQGNEGKLADLDKETAGIEKQLKAIQKSGNRDHSLGGENPERQADDAVRKALATAYKALKVQHLRLVEHLKKHIIKTDYTYAYRPPTNIEWLL